MNCPGHLWSSLKDDPRIVKYLPNHPQSVPVICDLIKIGPRLIYTSLHMPQLLWSYVELKWLETNGNNSQLIQIHTKI